MSEEKKHNKLIGGIILGISLLITSVYLVYRYGFLRTPKRNIPNDNSVFVSPANGEIISIKPFSILNPKIVETKSDMEAAAIEILTTPVSDSGTVISIRLQVYNVHYQRAMIDSKVNSIQYKPGQLNNAIKEGVRYENENCQVLFETPNGIKYLVVQIAGVAANQIKEYVQVDQSVKQGDIYGLIDMGSQVTIILPSTVSVIAKEGDIVLDGETILGKIT